MAYVKQNFADGQVLKAEHLNHMEDGFSTISWKDLQDKPFEEKVVEDFCDLTNPTDIYFDALGMRWYKISALTPSCEEMQNSTVIVNSVEEFVLQPTAEGCIFDEEFGCAFEVNGSGLVVLYRTGLLEHEFATINAPETGIYLGWIKPEEDTPHIGAEVSVKCGQISKLDKKFLPEVSALPEVTADDNGKVLGVVDGKWAAAQQEETPALPEVTADDNGKVLGVVDGKWAAAQQEETSALPEVTANDNGKVLGVVDGVWAATEAAVGGGGGTSATNYTVTKLSFSTSDTRVYNGASSCFLNIGSNDIITVGCMFKTSSAISVSEPGNTSFSFEATVSDEVKSRLSSLLGKKLNFTQQFMNAAYGGTDKGNLFWVKISLNASKVVMQIFPIKSLVAEESGRAIYSF